MKKMLFTLLFSGIGLAGLCQINDTDTSGFNVDTTSFNFDFEKIENEKPMNWEIIGKSVYAVSIDSFIKKSGKYSVRLENIKNTESAPRIAFSIPAKYLGEKITFSGFIKSENLDEESGGYTFLRYSPVGPYIWNKVNTGTNDWEKFELSAKVCSMANTLVFGGGIKGTGKIWLDNLKIQIDGKDIQHLAPVARNFKAKEDKEFDLNSGIDKIDLTERKIEDLKILGMIWGFLKYYHPKIAGGKLNWDYELFRTMPKILNVENAEVRDLILDKWIINLGIYEELSLKENEGEVKLKPDLDWISNSDFSKELTFHLLQVKNYVRENTQYYGGKSSGVGNAFFMNEIDYAWMPYPDTGCRLLSLYRYWNYIQYFFPYKYLIGEDWKEILEEFIPKFITAQNEIEYKLVVLELVARIHDTHASIWNGTLNDYWGVNFAPFEIKFIDNQAVVTDYYDDELGKMTGIEIGDIITKVNDVNVSDIIQKKLRYLPASNYITQLRHFAINIGERLLRTPDTIMTIEYLRNEKTIKKDIRMYTDKSLINYENGNVKIDIHSKYEYGDTCFKYISPDIVYINIGSLNTDNLPKLLSEVKNTKGIILDYRWYPRSQEAFYSLIDFVIPEKTGFVKFTRCSFINPGTFIFGGVENTGKKNPDYYKGKVMILVNEYTQSAGEFQVMALRVAPNAKVIGSQTAGADGNITTLILPGGIYTSFSGIGVYYPDGSETQRVGIIPDIEVKPTVQGIRDGIDEYVKKAIEIINSQ